MYIYILYAQKNIATNCLSPSKLEKPPKLLGKQSKLLSGQNLAHTSTEWKKPWKMEVYRTKWKKNHCYVCLPEGISKIIKHMKRQCVAWFADWLKFYEQKKQNLDTLLLGLTTASWRLYFAIYGHGMLHAHELRQALVQLIGKHRQEVASRKGQRLLPLVQTHIIYCASKVVQNYL